MRHKTKSQLSGIRFPTGIYVHLPFCQAKCRYCAFTSFAGLQNLIPDYVQAVLLEARWLARTFEGRASTMYIGGGTPSIVPVDLLAGLVVELRQLFRLPDDAEITCEANPGTIASNSLLQMRRAGINRLSLGCQSFDESELAMLGRIHDGAQIVTSFDIARKTGFGNINLDLIYGLPFQTMATWQETLRRALSLGPEHVSAYCLTLEDDTPMQQAVTSGRLPSPDPDLAADMYLEAEAILSRAGYRNYEISNWSLPGYQARHNLIYWHNQPYFGLGAAAHSSSVDRRWWNVSGVSTYINRLQVEVPASRPSPVIEDEEHIDLPLQMAETIIMGLRLTEEGIDDEEFQERFGISLFVVYGNVIETLTQAGLLLHANNRLKLTHRGRLLGNQVFFRFLP